MKLTVDVPEEIVYFIQQLAMINIMTVGEYITSLVEDEIGMTLEEYKELQERGAAIIKEGLKNGN